MGGSEFVVKICRILEKTRLLFSIVSAWDSLLPVLKKIKTAWEKESNAGV